MTLNYILKWDSCNGNLGSVGFPFMDFILMSCEVVLVRIPSMDQIELFENHLYSIRTLESTQLFVLFGFKAYQLLLFI